MQNLEQIRARNAFAYANNPSFSKGGQQDGEVIKKIPSLIMNHGFLATAALGCELDKNNNPKNKGWKDAFSAIAQHLSDPSIALLPSNCRDLDSMLRHLTGSGCNSEQLKLVTAESMQWLNYARRFVVKDKK